MTDILDLNPNLAPTEGDQKILDSFTADEAVTLERIQTLKNLTAQEVNADPVLGPAFQGLLTARQRPEDFGCGINILVTRPFGFEIIKPEGMSKPMLAKMLRVAATACGWDESHWGKSFEELETEGTVSIENTSLVEKETVAEQGAEETV